uniref:Autophagy-related protein n=1 Tax=Ditylenchus dipsaci TaxID=166011 RepID=A0A915ECD8_9BILA
MKVFFNSFRNYAEHFSSEKPLTLSAVHSSKCFYTPDYSSSSSSTSDSSSDNEIDSPSSKNIKKEEGKPTSTAKQQSNGNVTYKQKTRFCCRKSESALLHQKYPDKVALIVERFSSEKRLPVIEKCQFVVPKCVTVGQLQHVIRERCMHKSNMAVFVVVQGEIPALTTTIEELALKYRDEDGFLYVQFSSEDYFG